MLQALCVGFSDFSRQILMSTVHISIRIILPGYIDTLSLMGVDIKLLQNLSKMLLLKNIFFNFFKIFLGPGSPDPMGTTPLPICTCYTAKTVEKIFHSVLGA